MRAGTILETRTFYFNDRFETLSDERSVMDNRDNSPSDSCFDGIPDKYLITANLSDYLKKSGLDKVLG